MNLEEIMNQDGLSGGQCHCVLDFGCCRHWGGAEEGLDDVCVLCRQAVPKWWGIHVSRWCHSKGRAPGQATPGMGYWGVLSVVHGAVGSPSGHCLLTAHHLDSLWASWGFLSSEKVRSSLSQVGTPLRGSRLKAVCLTQYYIKMNAANSNLVPKTWATVSCLHKQHHNRNRTP